MSRSRTSVSVERGSSRCASTFVRSRSHGRQPGLARREAAGRRERPTASGAGSGRVRHGRMRAHRPGRRRARSSPWYRNAGPGSVSGMSAAERAFSAPKPRSPGGRSRGLRAPTRHPGGAWSPGWRREVVRRPSEPWPARTQRRHRSARVRLPPCARQVHLAHQQVVADRLAHPRQRLGGVWRVPRVGERALRLLVRQRKAERLARRRVVAQLGVLEGLSIASTR